MITIIQAIPSFVFSSALGVFCFSTSQDTAELTIAMDYGEILHETYTPDNSGTIRITGLDQLVTPYLATNLTETFSYTITDADESKTGTFKVVYAVPDISTTADDFVKNNFLTLMFGEKVTALGHREFVHLLPTESCDLTVECVYLVNVSTTVETRTIASIAASPNIQTEEVSPSMFVKDGMRLLYYTVKAGTRKQRFRVERYAVDAAPILLFTNSFGCQETFYCTGTHELNPEIGRSQAYMNGMYRTVNMDENRLFTANTGVLTPSMAALADDLIRSKEIYILDGTTVGKQVTITDSNSKRTNNRDELTTFDFTYRYTQRNQVVVQLARAGRVFDNTFDNTFE